MSTIDAFVDAGSAFHQLSAVLRICPAANLTVSCCCKSHNSINVSTSSNQLSNFSASPLYVARSLSFGLKTNARFGGEGDRDRGECGRLGDDEACCAFIIADINSLLAATSSSFFLNRSAISEASLADALRDEGDDDGGDGGDVSSTTIAAAAVAAAAMAIDDDCGDDGDNAASLATAAVAAAVAAATALSGDSTALEADDCRLPLPREDEGGGMRGTEAAEGAAGTLLLLLANRALRRDPDIIYV